MTEVFDPKSKKLVHVATTPSGSLVYDVHEDAREAFESEAVAGGKLETVLTTNKSATVRRFALETFAVLLGRERAPEMPNGAESPVSAWASKALEVARSLPEWQRLERLAQGNAWVASLAAAAVTEGVIKTLGEPPESEADIQQRIDALAKLMGQLRGRARKAARKQIEKLQKLLLKVRAESQKIADTGDEALRRWVSRFVAEAVVVVAEVTAAGDGASLLGGMGTGTAVVRRLLSDAQLRAVLARVGRIYASITARTRTRHTFGASEVTAVEQGGDLTRLLPSELALLQPTALGGLGAALVFSRLVDRSALQYQVRGREKARKGPVVVLVDASGSMAGKRADVGHSIALAICLIAIKDKRDAHVIRFNHSIVDEMRVTRGTSADDVTALMRGRVGGGTNEVKALNRAIEVLGELPSADVVIITDDALSGSADAHERIVQKLGERGAHLYGLQVDAYGGGSRLREVAEDWLEVRGEPSDDQLAVMFSRIGSSE